MSDKQPFPLGMQYEIFDYRTPRILEQDERDFLNGYFGWNNWELYNQGKYQDLKEILDNGLDNDATSKLGTYVYRSNMAGSNARLAARLLSLGLNKTVWNQSQSTGFDTPKTRQFIIDNFLLWYRRAKILPPLPDDSEADGFGPIQGIGAWPEQGPQKTRAVFWIEEWYNSIGRNPRQLLQISRYAPSKKRFYIFNQDGMDRTFARDGSSNSWTSGFDLLEWFNQNLMTLALGFQSIINALATIFTAGAASVGLVAGTAATLALAGVSFLQGVASGNAGMIFDSLSKIFGLTGLGDTFSKEFSKQINNIVNVIKNSPEFQSFSDAMLKVITTGENITANVAKIFPRVNSEYVNKFSETLGGSEWLVRGYNFPDRIVPKFAQPANLMGKQFYEIMNIQNQELVENSGMSFTQQPATDVRNIRRSSNVVTAALLGSPIAVQEIKQTPKDTPAGRSLQASIDIIKGQEYIRMLARKYGITL